MVLLEEEADRLEGLLEVEEALVVHPEEEGVLVHPEEAAALAGVLPEVEVVASVVAALVAEEEGVGIKLYCVLKRACLCMNAALRNTHLDGHRWAMDTDVCYGHDSREG